MRSVVLATLFGLVAAQSNASNATSTLTSLSQPSTTPISGIPTVTVLAGTYTEAVTIGQASVTIVGVTATAAADWSQNQVTVSNPAAALSIGSSNAEGITVRNINFVNSATTGAGAQAVALTLRGSNVAFYGCSIASPGTTVISVSTGTAFFANSYIEGSTQLFYNSLTTYVYNSTIVPLNPQAIVAYNKGTATANSTIVFDSSIIKPKSGNTYSGVFLAAPNGAGAVAVFRNTMMESLVSPAGIHPTAASYQPVFFGEFLSRGAGSYENNAATCSKYDVLLSLDQVSQFTIDKVYGNAIYSGYSSSSLGWIDQNIAASIQASYASQAAAFSQISSSTSESSYSSTPMPATISTSMSESSSSSANETMIVSATSSSMSAVATCSIPLPTTIVVSKIPGPCEFGNITSAIGAIANDGKDYTVRISAGTYVERFSITRKGKVTLRGATNFINDYTQNRVRAEFSSGGLNDVSGLALHNIDFVNTYLQTTNTAALAADFYGPNMAAYGCSFIDFQDTLLANKGTQVFSNCYIEVDFVWGFSTAYFHQCMIVSNTPGACIAAQSRADASTVGGYVFDSCMVIYSSTYGSSFGLSYLERPYSPFSIAVYMNSYIDKHISFATNLTETQASRYSLAAWIGDTTWLDFFTYNAQPSYALTGPSSAMPPINGTTTGPIATATVNAYPNSGMMAPVGAVIASVDGTHDVAFSSLTAALASLPKDSTNQTIFMYPGSYNEQVPSPLPIPVVSRRLRYLSATQMQQLPLSPLLPAGSASTTST
ncbi:pectinesterase [Parastagonospora nodorum]|nr:pectinesterase [Parastagonospora nodorum]